jgi:outer membrane usher protein
VPTPVSSISRSQWLLVRDRLQAVASRISVAAIIVLALAAAGDQTLLLELVVNGQDTGKVGEFVLRDGALFAHRSELTDLGIRVPDSVPSTQDDLIALSALPGVTSHLDQATQMLTVTAGTDRLLPTLLRAGATAGSGQAESGTGFTLDYDITGTLAGGQNVGSGLFDFRAFSPWGVASSSLLAYAGGNPTSAIRLDSTYVYSEPETLRRYRLGDFITGGLSWTRPVRLGGAQINSDFAMRPDLVTFPLASVGGSAAVPSSVDVLVNGTRLLSRELQPGPFQIPELPVVTGAGTVAMTVTDALGRQITTTLPFYASSDLLAPGLQIYSVEAGAVRRNWGLVSNDYANAVASATYRRGVSSDLTVEAHSEGTAGEFMAGAGVVVDVFNLGTVNLAAAASSGSGRTGRQFSVGAQRIGRVFSFGTSVISADHNFRDIAAMNGDPVPRRQINANAGISLGRFGSFGIAYTAVDRDVVPAPISFFAPPGTFSPQTTTLPGGVVETSGNIVSFLPAQHAHVLSASYSVQFGNLSFSATGFHDFASAGSSGVLFGVTIPIGSRSSASGSVGSGSGGAYAQVQAVQSPVSIGDWGYQTYSAASQPNHEFAELDYKSPWALLSAGADRIGRQTTERAEAQGALSYADGGMFASNPINDSFGVVDTNGVQGIRVYDENREIGRTDSAGRLLLPDLRSFDVNHIAIEPTDIPADATVPAVAQEVRPQDRSGVVVRFKVKTSHGALLRLVDVSGAPIPVGSTATLAATKVTVPVGYDGEAFVQDLSPRDNRVTVERTDGRRCAAVFSYRAKPGEIPTIGPLRCQEQ